jgi:flagellar basal body-associated protein FliL
MSEDNNKSQQIVLYSICVVIIIVFIATINACFTFWFGRKRRAVFCCTEIADVNKIDKIIATTTITTITIKERRSTMIKPDNLLLEQDKDKSSSLVRKEDMIITIEGELNRSFSRKNNNNLPTVMEEELEENEKDDKSELPSSVLIDSLDQKVDA